jgi:hypothetical protein
VLDYL